MPEGLTRRDQAHAEPLHWLLRISRTLRACTGPPGCDRDRESGVSCCPSLHPQSHLRRPAGAAGHGTRRAGWALGVPSRPQARPQIHDHRSSLARSPSLASAPGVPQLPRPGPASLAPDMECHSKLRCSLCGFPGLFLRCPRSFPFCRTAPLPTRPVQLLGGAVVKHTAHQNGHVALGGSF